MEAQEIKDLLKDHKKTISSIADELGVSQPTVSLTIKGTTVSARIRAAIAKAINKPVSEVWPEEAKEAAA